VKVGDLVSHYRWGKAIVLEMKVSGRFSVAMVRWLKPVISPQGAE
jgi:hypothetical protein